MWNQPYLSRGSNSLNSASGPRKTKPRSFSASWMIKIKVHTIDGNLDFVYSAVQLQFWRHKCQQFYVPADKTIKNRDNLRIKCFSYSKISAFLCSLFSVFALFYLILENMGLMGENFVFLFYLTLVISWYISQLPPIVIDNLFEWM